MKATARLGDYALSLRYEDLPGEVVERAKQLLLDFLGAACGGRALADSSAAIMQSVRELCAGNKGTASVVGAQELLPAHYAALLNGAFGHSMDFDDTHGPSHSHPGSPIFATLLALGETAHASGKDFLAAAVAAYEVFGRIGRAHDYGVHGRGFHPTATTGIFAAAAGGARLLGLDRRGLDDAWGINLSQAAGSLQYLENGAWTKRVHTGLAAHNAVVSLVMAKHGVVGAADPLEGRYGYYKLYASERCDLTSALGDLGRRFEVMATAIKPYPCCRCSHGVIDGVLALAREHRILGEDVREIEVGICGPCIPQVAEPEESRKAPKNIVDGQFSVFFGAAVAMLKGEYTWHSYDLLQDRRVRELMGRIRAFESPVDIVKITTHDGRRLVKEVPRPLGEPENFLTWDALLKKVRSLAEAVLARSRVDEMIALVSKLESVDDMAALGVVLRS